MSTNANKDLDREERRKRSELSGKPFSSVVRGRLFTSNHEVFGEDRLSLSEKKEQKKYEGVKHEKPFKYSNESKWIGKTINKHPDYTPQGEEESTTERLKKMTNYLPWRPTYYRKTEPSDSVTGNFMNRPKYSFM